MKKQWFIWTFIIGVVAVVLFALNYQGANEVTSLNDLFPEEEVEESPGIEYEFVEGTDETISLEPAQVASPAMKEEPAAVTPPAAQQVKAKPAAPAADLSSVAFTIQVASSRDKARAEKALAKVKEAGYPAYLGSTDLGEKGVWHRIYIGNFNTKAEAQEYLSRVKADYKDSFIIKPNK